MSNDKYRCFFVSPIKEIGSAERRNSDLVMDLLLKPALIQCGFLADNIVRSDQLSSANIQVDMMDHLENDELCVIDISGGNQNVMFEYGYRKGLGKSYIVIKSMDTSGTQKDFGDYLPLDIKTERIIHYDLQSPDALMNLPGTIETLRKQVQNRIDEGFFDQQGRGSVQEISSRLRAIEKKLDNALAGISFGSAAVPEADRTVQKIIQSLGSPNAAFNYALRQRDAALAEALMPKLQATMSKDKFIDYVVAQTAMLGSVAAAAILKNEWPYIKENMPFKMQYEELGCYVSYCVRRDLEPEEIDFVITEATQMLDSAQTIEQKAGLYNQMNRISYGAYKTLENDGKSEPEYLNKAIEYLQKAIELNPEQPSYYYNLAICKNESGDIKGSVEAIKKCIDLDTDDDDHLSLAYRIFKDQGMTDEAMRAFAKLKEINPVKADSLV